MDESHKIKDPLLEASIQGYLDTMFYGFKVAKKRYKRKIKDLIRSGSVIVLKNRRKRGSNGFGSSGK
jgi:hypothetical protein